MKVVMIGSGNVASVLGRLIDRNQHKVVHVAGRNPGNAISLAKEFDCSFSGLEELRNIEADLFIVAISDDGLNDISSFIHTNPIPVVHTAGSVPMEVLKHVSSQYGVLYPLQSLRKEMVDIPDIPFLVDGNDSGMQSLVGNFAASLSPYVELAGDSDRLRLHTAAVIVSNFTNHLYALGEEFCEKEKVNFNLLKPLIVETANRILTASPAMVQTGPAVRKDIQTLDKHLRILNDYPKLRTTYLRLTESIMNP